VLAVPAHDAVSGTAHPALLRSASR
jgi:hypothetical protein